MIDPFESALAGLNRLTSNPNPGAEAPPPPPAVQVFNPEVPFVPAPSRPAFVPAQVVPAVDFSEYVPLLCHIPDLWGDRDGVSTSVGVATFDAQGMGLVHPEVAVALLSVGQYSLADEDAGQKLIESYKRKQSGVIEALRNLDATNSQEPLVQLRSTLFRSEPVNAADGAVVFFDGDGVGICPLSTAQKLLEACAVHMVKEFVIGELTDSVSEGQEEVSESEEESGEELEGDSEGDSVEDESETDESEAEVEDLAEDEDAGGGDGTEEKPALDETAPETPANAGQSRRKGGRPRKNAAS